MSAWSETTKDWWNRILWGIVFVESVPLVSLLACHFPGQWETEGRVRIASLIFQLLGLFGVAKGINNTRKAFGKANPLAAAWNAIKDAPISPPKSKTVETNSTSSFGSGVTAFARQNSEEESSVDERVSDLETAISEHINSTKSALAQEASQREYATAAEREARERDIKALHKKLEQLSVGGLTLAWIGIAWLFLGIVSATLSIEIGHLLSALCYSSVNYPFLRWLLRIACAVCSATDG
jgi:hypothetical protein